ncbi:unnamed protein product [Rotaria sp. Silwood1]|nr:unnamed protein product [Rotaria sp. Silwood1]
MYTRRREDKEEEEEEGEGEGEERNDHNNAENASDEGIDDAGSDAGTTTNDYLISTVSKSDLELMKKHCDSDNDSLSLSGFIANGIEQLKSILTNNNNNQSNEDEKIKFDLIHKQFTSLTRELEQFIGAYINVMFSKTKRTYEGLSILASFEPVCERNYLRSILRDAYVNLFLNFENDLLDIRTTFEAHKDDPPLPRNAPPVPGAIAWSRTLLTKIEQAMDVFKLNRHIVTLGNFPLISKLYNRTAKALLVYEQLLLGRWKEKIDAWKDHLNANLLCLVNDPEENNKRIEINSNIELFSIFDEVKWFKRLDVDIPKAALICMQKEQTFKHYKSLLDDLLTRFRYLQSRIYPPFYPLFTSHLSQVYRAFEPGLHTLTWSSLNIDAYIAKVHRALDRFETSISNINTLIAEKIDSILDNELMNSSCLLFSIDYIRSKLWTPTEFLENMRSHLNEQSILIGEKLHQIQQTFQEVEDMLKLNSTGPKSRSSTSSTRRVKTATPAVTNEAMMEFVRYYHDKMNYCIQKIIERTLVTYIDLVSITETKYLIDQTKLIRFLFEGQDIDEQLNVDT